MTWNVLFSKGRGQDSSLYNIILNAELVGEMYLYYTL